MEAQQYRARDSRRNHPSWPNRHDPYTHAIAGKELTGDNLKEALDGIRDWDTGGLIGVPVNFRNNSIPVGRIYQGNSATGRMDPVSDWIVLDD